MSALVLPSFYIRKDGVAVARMVDAEFEYTYEYQGNAPKLVHTPLTDKCYLTLTQVSHFVLWSCYLCLYLILVNKIHFFIKYELVVTIGEYIIHRYVTVDDCDNFGTWHFYKQADVPSHIWKLSYLVIMFVLQGMNMGLGGNPYGPAGTGKTESVKALGSLLGRQVLVFNCDEVRQ